jgi:hypothetical protein
MPARPTEIAVASALGRGVTSIIETPIHSTMHS